jgi:two-component system, sensor histidine kinase YesM
MAFSYEWTQDFHILRPGEEPLYFLEPPESRFYQLEESSFLASVREARGRNTWIGPSHPSIADSEQAYFTMGRSVIHPQSLRELGQFFLFINPEVLEAADSLGTNSETDWSIITSDGGIVYETNPDILRGSAAGLSQEQNAGTYFDADGREYLFTASKTAQDWTLVSFKSVESMNEILQPARWFTLGIVTGLLVLLFLFHKLFSQRLLHFFQQLRQSMSKASTGDLEVQMGAYRESEFTTLASGFNHMVTDLRSTIRQVEQEQSQKQDAQFQVLQHQINPHFLYNTLDSVNALTSLQKIEEAQHLVTNLGRLLRISLKGPYEIPLDEELRHVRSYLEIQRVRHVQSFDYHIDAEAEPSLPVLKLILQPLVENAIEHGRSAPDLFITVRTKQIDGALHMTVHDNGPGFSEEVLLALNSGRMVPGDGFGVRNVHERLHLFYQNQSGLIICSEPGNTTIRLLLPEKRDEHVPGNAD